MREGPWGSHHDEASALKWETSSGETVVKAGSAELESVVSVRRRQDVDAKERGAGCRDHEDAVVVGVRRDRTPEESFLAATKTRFDTTVLGM